MVALRARNRRTSPTGCTGAADVPVRQPTGKAVSPCDTIGMQARRRDVSDPVLGRLLRYRVCCRRAYLFLLLMREDTPAFCKTTAIRLIRTDSGMTVPWRGWKSIDTS